MAGVHPEPLLVAVGVIVVSAFFASLAFRLFRLPDTIFLIGLGMLLGPALHWVDVELFRAIAPFIGTVALIVILFEGGLKIHLAELAEAVAPGALLALLVFGATALLCALVGMIVLGLDGTRALLLGMSLGGAGAVIVIPLIQRMEVGSAARTMVSIEAAVSDILVVLAVVGFATAIQLSQSDPADFLVQLAQTFAIGLVLGVAGGLGWVAALRAFKERSYEYVLTVSVLFLLYVATEFIGGSGPLAVLVFGLVVGNSRKVETLAQEERREATTRHKRTWTYAPVFGGELVSLHHEVIFFLRAFFFVTLGAVVDLHVFTEPRFLAGGILLALAVVLGRFWGATVLLFRSRQPVWDRLAVALMFPLGLAAAVVSLIPSSRFQLSGTENFGAYAIVAIVTTNLLAAAAVFWLSQPRIRARLTAPPKPAPGWTANRRARPERAK
jgi:Na+:H+ antiporter